MIPLWLTFIMCGLVSSVGDTFFIDQGSNLDLTMNPFSPILLLIFQKIAESMFATVTKKLIKKGSRKYAAAIGNIAATIISILCCITAAKVETRRLEVIKSHGLIDKPDEQIPMSMFWLLPQFLLLGALDGISHNLLSDFSIACFFNGEVPDSISSYLRIFSNSVFGIGIWGGVLSVYIVGKVKPSWFRNTPNGSRLDNYY
jgi:peptide/histidine transporter 3/4